MATPPIVRKDGLAFREYTIQTGDTLSEVCFRFGVPRWRRVYELPQNAPFRQRFPDPDVISDHNAPSFYIPLVGSDRGGVKLRGAPAKSYVGAMLQDQSGVPLPNIKLRLVLPGQKHEGIEVTTDADGQLVHINPPPGDVFLASAEYQLVAPADAARRFQPVDVARTVEAARDPRPDPIPDLKLSPDILIKVVARRAIYLICPQCNITYKTVRDVASGPAYTCPNDELDLAPLQASVETNEQSFSSPAGGQDPKLTPASLTSRGTEALGTAHGIVTVYWDESRFLSPNGSTYTLWGKLGTEPERTVTIIGRADWGAAPPIFTPNSDGSPRSYEFQLTRRGATTEFPYNSIAIPSNENAPLNTTLLWMTIHHSVNPDTPQEVQHEHQHVGIGNNSANKAADVGYHFVVTSSGEIFEGRPLGIKGAHAERFNGGNLGIVLCGNFETPVIGDDPSPAAITSLDRLVDVLAARFQISSVWSHRERKRQAKVTPDTECPGQRLIPHVNDPIRKKFPGPPP